jgi:hypothetical protein
VQMSGRRCQGAVAGYCQEESEIVPIQHRASVHNCIARRQEYF